jgi:TRAP-type C4-dicarboxylate transport system substrate-binding protein
MAPGGLPNAEALFGGIPEWISTVEERTEGRIEIECYYGETLAKGREVVDALETGLADVIFPAPHHQPGKLPLFTIGNVAGLSDDFWAKSMAFFELLTTEKALRDEFAQYGGRPIGAAYYPPCGLISTSPLATLDDVKGRKISARYPASDMLTVFEAAPLALAPPEEYEALLRGTVDALAAPVAAVLDFNFYEVGKYYSRFNLGDRNHALIISEDAWAKLSPGDQKILEDLAPEYTQMAYDCCAVGLEPRGLDIVKENGVEVFMPSEADAAKLLSAAEALGNQWVSEMDGKGLPGTALMSRYEELIKQYEAKSPYKK